MKWRDQIKKADRKNTLTDLKIIKGLFSFSDIDLLNSKITKIASKIDVQPSTITKFLYKNGFSGFNDFKIKIAINVLEMQKEQKKDYLDHINTKNISEFIIENKNKNFYIISHGLTRYVSKIFTESLRIMGIVAFEYGVTDNSINFFNSNSIYVYISISGKTQEIIKSQRKASNTNSKVLILSVYNQISNTKVKHNYFLNKKSNNDNLNKYLNGVYELSKFFSDIIKNISKNRILKNVNIGFGENN